MGKVLTEQQVRDLHERLEWKDMPALCRSHEALRAQNEALTAAAQKALGVWEQTYIHWEHSINLAHAMIALRALLAAAPEKKITVTPPEAANVPAIQELVRRFNDLSPEQVREITTAPEKEPKP